MTNTSRNVRNAVRLALAACATTATGPLVYAQAAAESAAPAERVQEVVVTGSRIPQAPNDISISPISSISADDVQRTGFVRTEDLLNSLPQVVADQGSGLSISSIGTATISLRGLGSARTLVLVDGRRLNPGGSGGVPPGSSSSADINQIPADLIERADVLTGGASSVYGADAVAGVVNFVLNTHYEGVKVDANYGFNNHKNNNAADLGYLAAAGQPIPQSTVNTGQNKDLSIIAGANFADGKGNATVYATYLNSAPAAGYQFDHAGCTLQGGTVANSPITCGGSGTSGHGQFLLLGKTAGGAATTVVDNAVDPKTGAFRPFNNGVDAYNYGALSYFQRQAERYTAGAFLHYDVNEHASVYTETMFARNTSQAQYGPSGDFFGVHTTSCANPLLTPAEKATICNPVTLAQNEAVYGNPGTNNFTFYLGRRNVEGGGRQDNYTSSSIRQVVGVKGQFADAWSYDAYGQVGITQFADFEGNFLGKDQINNSLDVVTGPAGTPVCASGGACVPWNVWVPGGVTQAALTYLTVPSSYQSSATEYITSGSITGDLGKYGVKLPTANSGLAVNFGSEFREEKFIFNPDFIFANGLAAGGSGNGSKPIDGKFHVWEGFTEARLPLIDEKPGAYNLSAEVGYRYSSYTLGFNTNTYKIGLEWAPIQDVRIRGSYNRAVRAPNIDELFEPAAIGAGGTADPCWGPAPSLSAAACANTGVTAAEYGHITVNPAAQINTQQGGNANLVPEIADTYSVGFVVQPQIVPNLVASVDFFSIKIKNTITSLTSNTIINNCAASGDPALCGLIHRGPTGSLWLNETANYVQATNLNIGTVSTKGLDVAAHYRLDIASYGRLGFNLSGAWTKDFLTQPLPTGLAYDCAGFWGTTCSAPDPKWRHVFNTNWGLPWAGIELTARWRFIGHSDSDHTSSDPQLATQPAYALTQHIPAYNYFDLSAAIPVWSGIEFRMGVNNIADKNPPVILNGSFSDCPNTTCNDNTWAGTYDTLGRYVYAHISAKF
jgi:iron complex outermembrane recepter protein